MRVFGFDTGMRSFGWAVADYMRSSGEREIRAHFIAAGVFHTEPNKEADRKGDDMSRRTRMLWSQLHYTSSTYGGRPAFLCTEAVAFPFGHVQVSVVSGLGRARALVDVLAAELKVPIYESLAKELKEAVTGNKSAEKDEVCAKLQEQYPEIGHFWPKLKADREHIADACASIIAAQKFNWAEVRSAFLRRQADEEIPF
jgi:Holliday junction resolvasome RuvABC endonuclease subunit